MADESLRAVRMIADYQFGKGAGKVLFPDSCRLMLSSTGRVRQVIDGGVRIATVKADSGWLTLSIEGAKRLHDFLPHPRLRVIVMEEVAEFIAAGKSVFAKHVVNVDENIRAGEEVLVVDTRDKLLATGKCLLSAFEMLEMDRGVAVKVRQGVERK